MMDQKTILRKVSNGQCPFCNKKGFKSIAGHTYQAHGITGFQLREMAGLQITAVITSDELHERLSHQRQTASPERKQQILEAMAAGRKPEVIAQRANSWARPEGRNNQEADRNRPERKAMFKETMASPDIDRSAIARARSPEVVAQQTERVQKAQEEWRNRLGPEEVSRSRKEVISNLSPEAKERMIVGRLKATEVAKVRIVELHQDPEWKNRWKQNHARAMRKKAKILPEEFPIIASRYKKGETQQTIANDYGVSRRWIGKILKAY